MSALTPRRRRRRSDPLGCLVYELGTTKRTVRRWLTERPELRETFRAVRKGSQWRISFPSREAEWIAYVADIQQAIVPFRRRRKTQLIPSFRWLLKTLGHRTPRLEIGVGLLRHAMFLKWVRLHRPLSLLEWLDESAHCFAAARMAMYESRDEIGGDVRNAEHALSESALKWWPDEEDWTRASAGTAAVRFDWENLLCAALECYSAGKRISGPNLAPLMFRNRRHLDAWYLHAQSVSVSSIRTADGIFFPAPATARGISLRTFRTRYTSREIAKIIGELCTGNRNTP